MANQAVFDSVEVTAATPTSHTVSREVNLQLGYLGLDSVYLVIEYPGDDVFKKWADVINYDFEHPELYQGIPEGDVLIRRGALGYKLSVWMGDARLFMTDRVSDNGAQGMGLMLQLGPRWLVQYGQVYEDTKFKKNVMGQLMLFGVKHPEQYPARLNRLDLTIDLIGLRVSDLSVDEWREQWVGFSKVSGVYFSRKSGELEGLSVGSSTGAVRFKLYDKVAESKVRNTTRFWRSVWGVEDCGEVDVARLEWSVKCYHAKFANMRYLSDFTFEGFLDLLNYVTLKWGKLCVPGADDSNKSRWPLSPLWEKVRALVDDWSFNYEGMAAREYHLKRDIDFDYLQSVAGWLAGLQARVSLEEDRESAMSVTEALNFLEDKGYGAESMFIKANRKLERFKRLTEGGPDDAA